MNSEERINSIRITDVKGTIGPKGDVYELDFNRDAVRFAESNNFKLEEVLDFPATNIPNLFYYAFRMHHRKIAREKTDKLLEAWGGVSESVLKRLIALYNQAALSNAVQIDEDSEKNEAVAVEL